MQHMASFGILLRKGDEDKRHENTDAGYDEGDMLPVHKAAAEGDITSLVQIIQEDPSLLEQHSAEGVTPLGQAVLGQQLEVAKKLIKMGANIDAQDNTGRTCLSIAAYQGWHNGVVCLLRNGAKQSICDKSGRYPLHAATYHSDISTMTILLSGLTKREINFPDHELMTAVHWAAFHDRPEHLMQLIQKGGDVLARDVDGKLPLHWAAQNGSFQCTHRLISLTEGLAMVNDLDSSGKAPAHYAAAAGSANILKIIERCETVDLEVEDPDERTPLHWAAAMGHAGAVETLLKLGVNANPHDVDGYTPMDYAIQTGSKDCVKAFETHLGHNPSGVKEKKKYQLSHEDLKHRTNQAASSDQKTQGGPAPKDGIPAITVQAPTTTISKATTNSDAMYPRMYSASTDTDAPIFKPQQIVESPPSTPATTRHVDYKEPLNARWTKENAQGGALSKLVGASYILAAQAPILHGPDQGYDQPQDRMAKPAKIPKEQVISPRGDPSLDVAPETEKWASTAPRVDSVTGRGVTNLVHGGTDADQSEPPEMQIMTSGNTPELQRVSVQSFRSVPPISAGSAKKETVAPRQPADRIKGLRLQGARLTPLPGITPKGGPPLAEVEQEDPVTPRKMTELEPLVALRGPLRVLDEDIQAPISGRAHAPPVDFMTENNAETRILTRKYKNTLSRFYDVAVRQQSVQASAKAFKSSVPAVASTAHTNNAGASKPTAAQSHPSASYKDASVKFFKHSRIPSTRVGAHHPDSVNAVGVHEPAATENLNVPRNNKKSTTILSSAGMFRTTHEKYIREDEDNVPSSPTPLAAQPSSILAARLGGQRRAQERLLANLEASKRKQVDAHSNPLKLHQHEHQPVLQKQQGEEALTGKTANAGKKSVNFTLEKGGSRNPPHIQNTQGFQNGKQHRTGQAERAAPRREGGMVAANRGRVKMPVLRPANLVKSKN